MALPEGSQRMKVAVLLPRQPDDLGQWLVDAAAFDAAGADALWVDLAPDPHLDPLAVTAALAAVTSRAMLVAALPAPADASAVPTRALATIARVSRGRLRIAGGAVAAGPPDGVGLSVAAAGHGAPSAGGYEVEAAERWAPAPPPHGRAAWRTTLLDAAEGGFAGVLVPADPRLIDILRNPDDPGQRLDLHLASG